MLERTGANFVIFVPCGFQATPQSEDICFDSPGTMGDEELSALIRYAKERGVRVAVKPTVNCCDGTWRAYIDFFDKEVVCEPKWSRWFASYTAFQLHYARLAEDLGCDMFIAGCEMVQSERREAEWRRLIADIKGVYSGPVSYNTDKYQEDNVSWWDCVDVISSSGYYPVDDWERQLDRVEKVVRKFGKPFFFAESGCMSRAGSDRVPNDWRLRGETDLEAQAAWYRAALEAGAKRDWLGGFAFWSWEAVLPKCPEKDGGYGVFGKPAEAVVRELWAARPENA